MTVDQLLERLEGVRVSGNGYVAICPAHDDTEPSLGIAEGENEILLKCHAGCSTDAVVQALGIEMSDLFFGARASRPAINYGEPEAVYDYVDEFGNTLFQAVRFPNKQFKQRHLAEGAHDWSVGPYVWNLQDVRRVLYRLPQVIEAKLAGRTIYVVEGEKDVHTIEDEGYVATCNPMGAGKWRDEFSDTLVGANVIIVQDRDDPGRKHAETVRASLVGKARGIWVVQAKVGKDVTDHVEAGHSITDLTVRKARSRKGIVTAHELAAAGLEELNMRPEDIPSYPFSPALPFAFRSGRVYAVGAYTSDGKTRFGLQGLRTLATAGTHVGYFSLEMPERDLRNILVAHRGVPLALTERPWDLKNDPVMLQTYKDALAEIDQWNIDITFESGMDAEKIIEYTRDREYDVVIVDHIHRMSWGRERRQLEEQLQKLTNLALDANICVVLLCQLRKQMRGKDQEIYPEPTLEEFRETGVISQEASMALSIWRQRLNGLQYTGSTQIRVLKNRHSTGAQDAAGAAYYPHFDRARESFTEGGSNEQPAIGNHPEQAGPGAWD